MATLLCRTAHFDGSFKRFDKLHLIVVECVLYISSDIVRVSSLTKFQQGSDLTVAEVVL